MQYSAVHALESHHAKQIHRTREFENPAGAPLMLCSALYLTAYAYSTLCHRLKLSEDSSPSPTDDHPDSRTHSHHSPSSSHRPHSELNSNPTLPPLISEKAIFDVEYSAGPPRTLGEITLPGEVIASLFSAQVVSFKSSIHQELITPIYEGFTNTSTPMHGYSLDQSNPN